MVVWILREGLLKMVFKKGQKNYWLGKKRPDVTKRNLEDNPMENPETKKKHRERIIEKIKKGERRSNSKAIKKLYSLGILKPNKTTFKKGNKPWNKNLTKETDDRVKKSATKMADSKKEINLSKEHKIRISESMKEYIKDNPEERIRLKKQRNMVILPVEDTSIEIKIQDFLKKLGIEFYTHFWINFPSDKYRCDIFIPSRKLVIETDGDYWHGNPEVFSDEKLTKRILKQRKIDKKRTEQLVEKGFKVLRLWENEIKVMKINHFKERLNEI